MAFGEDGSTLLGLGKNPDSILGDRPEGGDDALGGREEVVVLRAKKFDAELRKARGARGTAFPVNVEGHACQRLEGLGGEMVACDHVRPDVEDDRVAGDEDLLLDVGHVLGGELECVLEEPHPVVGGDVLESGGDVVVPGNAALGQFSLLEDDCVGVRGGVVGEMLHRVLAYHHRDRIRRVHNLRACLDDCLFGVGQGACKFRQPEIPEDPAQAEVVVAEAYVARKRHRIFADEDRLRLLEVAAAPDCLGCMQGAYVAFGDEDLSVQAHGAFGDHEAAALSGAAFAVGRGGVEDVDGVSGKQAAQRPVPAGLRPERDADLLVVSVVCARQQLPFGDPLHRVAEADDCIRDHDCHAAVEVHDIL